MQQGKQILVGAVRIEQADHPHLVEQPDQRRPQQESGQSPAPWQALATKQQQAVHTLQDNARLLGDLSRAQGDLHQVQEGVASENGK